MYKKYILIKNTIRVKIIPKQRFLVFVVLYVFLSSSLSVGLIDIPAPAKANGTVTHAGQKSSFVILLLYKLKLFN